MSMERALAEGLGALAGIGLAVVALVVLLICGVAC